MPALETFDCVDDAVVWLQSGTDVNGAPVVEYPRRLKVRWVDRRSSGGDPQSNRVSYDASIAASACLDIPNDSIVWHGRLGDIPGTADPPTPSADLFQVKTSSHARDVNGRICRREYGLQRFHDSMPTVLPLE